MHQPQSRSAVTAFAAEPTSATAARRFTRQTLETAGIAQNVSDRAELIVSELVTNAVLHAGTGPVVSIRFSEEKIRIEVEDTSPAAPVLREYGLDASTGRGLRVVGHIANEWGVETTANGKSVWAVLEVATAHNSTDVPPLQVTFKELKHAAPSSTFKDIPDEDTNRASLHEIPVALYLDLERHHESLVREFALLSIQFKSHPDSLPSALSEAINLFSTIDVRFTMFRLGARTAYRQGKPIFSMNLELTAKALTNLQRFAEWTEMADTLSRDNLLLTAQATPEQYRLRRWMMNQITEQIDSGASPSKFPE